MPGVISLKLPRYVKIENSYFYVSYLILYEVVVANAALELEMVDVDGFFIIKQIS